jgi:hypothetical protein
VDTPDIRFCIDFGASSLIALERLGIAHNSIDLNPPSWGSLWRYSLPIDGCDAGRQARATTYHRRPTPND